MKKRGSSFVVSLFVFIFFALPFSVEAGIFSADKPDLKCELASVKKVLQTAEKISNKSPDYKYYKWECVNLGGKYDWYERGNQEKTPFAGVDFDSSVPSDKRGGGSPAIDPCLSAGGTCSPKCGTGTHEDGKCSGGALLCCKTGAGSGGGSDPKCSGTGSTCSPKCGTGTHEDGKCSDGKLLCCKSDSSSGGGGGGGAGGGSGTGGGTQSLTFDNPLKFDYVDEVLTSIMTTLQKLVVTLALLFLVLGAIMYIISAGNDTRMKSAKGVMTASMIGMAIALAAPSFLKEIYTVLSPKGTMAPELSNASNLSDIALNVLNFLLSVVGILTMIMLVIGAIMYLTAMGDEKKVEDGKKIVKFSLIGITIAFASLVIVQQIAKFFG